MEVFLFLFIIFASFCFCLLMISWLVHISMNKDEDVSYDWCTFNTFIKEFNKYKDNPYLKVKKHSITLGNYLYYAVYLNASIIKFDEKCMILYPVSWLKYCVWNYRLTSSRNKNKGLWK